MFRPLALSTLLLIPGFALAQEDVVQAPEIPFEAAQDYDSEAFEPEWYRTFTLSNIETFNSAVRVSPLTDIGMEWQQGDRWSFNVRMRQRMIDEEFTQSTDVPAQEMTAGANFNITPRISVGGTVNFGSQQIQGGTPFKDQELDAGVKLQSAFKF